MPVTNKELIANLDKLETYWADDEQRLNIAIQHAEAGSYGEKLLRKMANDRCEFQQQVQERIQAYGFAPPSGVSIRRRIRKVLTATESAVSFDSLAINLEECLEGANEIKKFLSELHFPEYPKSIAQLFKYQLKNLEKDIEVLNDFYKSHSGRKKSVFV